MEPVTIGQKVFLIQVISLFDRQLSENFADSIETVRQFKEKFEALRYDVGVSTKGSSVSPACHDVAQGVTDAANMMKLEMLRDLNQIIATQKPSFSFRAWMETRRENYKAWLTRL